MEYQVILADADPDPPLVEQDDQVNVPVMSPDSVVASIIVKNEIVPFEHASTSLQETQLPPIIIKTEIDGEFTEVNHEDDMPPDDELVLRDEGDPATSSCLPVPEAGMTYVPLDNDPTFGSSRRKQFRPARRKAAKKNEEGATEIKNAPEKSREVAPVRTRANASDKMTVEKTSSKTTAAEKGKTRRKKSIDEEKAKPKKTTKSLVKIVGNGRKRKKATVEDDEGKEISEAVISKVGNGRKRKKATVDEGKGTPEVVVSKGKRSKKPTKCDDEDMKTEEESNSKGVKSKRSKKKGKVDDPEGASSDGVKSKKPKKKGQNKKGKVDNLEGAGPDDKTKDESEENSKKKYPCEICHKKFLYPSSVKRHMQTHAEECNYPCPLCDTKLAYQFSLLQHMNKVHKEKMTSFCEACKYGFQTEAERDEHRRNNRKCASYTGEKCAPLEKPLRCKFCSKRFSHIGNFTSHVKTHNGVKAFQCEVCERRFRAPHILINHRYTHPELGPKPLQCDHCDLRFARRDRLKRHILIVHEGQKLYKCDVCGKELRRLDSFKSHKLIHEGGFRFLCTLCGQGFNWHSSFNAHMMMHSDKKAYTCSVCSRTFTHPSVLKTHMMGHEGIAPHACPKCPAKFRKLNYLNNHLKTHEDARPFECKHCGKGFRRRDNLEDHLLTHSDFKPFKCDHCDKRFNNAGNARQHMVRIHNVKREFKYQRSNNGIRKSLGVEALVKSIETADTSDVRMKRARSSRSKGENYIETYDEVSDEEIELDPELMSEEVDVTQPLLIVKI